MPPKKTAPGLERNFAEALRFFKTAEHEQALALARRAAYGGHARAMVFLSLIYEHGLSRGLAHDRERKGEKRLAAYWRQKAAEAGYKKRLRPEPVFPEVAMLREAEDYADQNNPERDDHKAAALYDLGLRYREGRGLGQDDAQAADCFRRAAEGCSTEARWMMGHICREGRGVERNMSEAVRWYRKAVKTIGGDFSPEEAGKLVRTLRETITADGLAGLLESVRTEAKGGNVDACFLLGLMYVIGLRENPAQAAFWIKKAARAGDAEALYLLGNLTEQGMGMKKSIRSALRWRQKAAEKDFFFSGNIECFGEDWDGQRRRWLRRQAKKGNKFALCELAIWEKRPQQRARLLRQAAERGNMTAQHYLALAYCTGEGVRQDYAEAARWYKESAANPEKSPHFDNELGWPQSELGHLYREGKGVERDPAQSARWYEKSLNDANCCSALALGMAYEYGYGVEQDLDKAASLYRSNGGLRGVDDLAEFFLECLEGVSSEG